MLPHAWGPPARVAVITNDRIIQNTAREAGRWVAGGCRGLVVMMHTSSTAQHTHRASTAQPIRHNIGYLLHRNLSITPSAICHTITYPYHDCLFITPSLIHIPHYHFSTTPQVAYHCFVYICNAITYTSHYHLFSTRQFVYHTTASNICHTITCLSH